MSGTFSFLFNYEAHTGFFYKNNSFPDEYIAAKSRKFYDASGSFCTPKIYNNQDKSKTENNFKPEKLQNVMFVYKKSPFRLMSSVQQVTNA